MDEEGEDHVTKSIVTYFAEKDVVLQLIDDVPFVYNDLRKAESAYAHFLDVLSRYQEEPNLLDKHLDQMVDKLLVIISDAEKPMMAKHLAFKYLYIIIKVRQYKVVMKHLPHEVSDMEYVLQLISHQDKNDTSTWESRYVLLLWLAMLVILPFDLEKLGGDQIPGAMIERLLSICREYLVVTDKASDSAALLTARLLTRPDVKEKYLGVFLESSSDLSSNDEKNTVSGYKFGVLRTLCHIWKLGKRQDMLPYAAKMLDSILSCDDLRSSSNTLERKFFVKLLQRIGLTFLQAHLAPWRYKRGHRVLMASDAVNNTQEDVENKTAENTDEEEEMEVPPQVEEVIEELLFALRDKETLVRWSAAKGVGRITERLPLLFGDEVVASVLGLFSHLESDSAWHGGCLCLAELGRRGLLLPSRLSAVVPVIQKALVYDEPRGNFSIGSNIRDAAAYVCWAFARAYQPSILAPYMSLIAPALLIMAVFDREVNCRQAASAAFQEQVGRQGDASFPHGIHLLTTVDYIAVANRARSYLQLSLIVAACKEYTELLIQHLISKKLNHWDKNIRLLASQALYNLTPLYAQQINDEIMPLLLKKAVSDVSVHERHGSLLGLAEVIQALSLIPDIIISPICLGELEVLVPNMDKKHCFRGAGADLVRQGVAAVIYKVSLAHLPLHHKQEVLDDWREILDSSLIHPEEAVRQSAVSALNSFVHEYYQENSLGVTHMINKYVEGAMKAAQPTVRSGLCQGLGSLPLSVLLDEAHKLKYPQLLNCLLHCTTITEKTKKWAASRRDSFGALATICKAYLEQGYTLESSEIKRIVDAIFLGLGDYTCDSKGDIGSWTRQAAIGLLRTVFYGFGTLIQTSDHVEAIGSLIQQGCECIDRVRALAIQTLSVIVHSENASSDLIPQLKVLRDTIPDESSSTIWSRDKETFPLLVPFVLIPPYSQRAIVGLAVAAGGLSGTLRACSSKAAATVLSGATTEQLALFGTDLIEVLEEYKLNDRVSIPFLRFLECLTSFLAPLFRDPTSQFAVEIMNLTKSIIKNSKIPEKLQAGAAVLCNLLQADDDSTALACVDLIGLLLVHRFPRVRQSTAHKLYELLVTVDKEDLGIKCSDQDSLDEIITLLSETSWDEELDVLIPIKDKVCNTLNNVND